MDRFWSKVNKDGPVMDHMDTPCWEWEKSLSARGYGQFHYQGTTRLAHRLSALLSGIIDDIHEDIFICHSCDNRKCVNPEHLWKGTNQDNMRDCAEKGRMDHRGMNNQGCAKITDDDVREIRRLLEDGALLHREIADRIGCSSKTISLINTGKQWTHV